MIGVCPKPLSVKQFLLISRDLPSAGGVMFQPDGEMFQPRKPSLLSLTILSDSGVHKSASSSNEWF